MTLFGINRFALPLALGLLLVGSAFASGQKGKKAAVTPCPVCHMPLASKMSKANPVAVRLKKGGPVMYCCAGCKMPASVLVKKTTKKPHKSNS